MVLFSLLKTFKFSELEIINYNFFAEWLIFDEILINFLSEVNLDILKKLVFCKNICMLITRNQEDAILKLNNSCSWGSCSNIPLLYFGVSTTYISSICFDQTCKKAFPAWPTVYVCHILGILHLRKFCIMDIKIILRKDHLTKILFGINPLSKCN